MNVAEAREKRRKSRGADIFGPRKAQPGDALSLA